MFNIITVYELTRDSVLHYCADSCHSTINTGISKNLILRNHKGVYVHTYEGLDDLVNDVIGQWSTFVNLLHGSEDFGDDVHGERSPCGVVISCKTKKKQYKS